MAATPGGAGRSLCLGILVFICGWALMMLEMLGARILAPSFGTGIYVWGSVIGVFLLALSAGYSIGGWLSARFPRAAGMAALIVVCGAWMGALPLIHRPVNDWLFDWWVVGQNGGEQWGSLMAAVILFLLPSVMLGTVSPFAVRLAATDIGSVGQKAGLLYAISTLGSFLGCMATSFYLIVWMGINRILQVHAVLLMVTAVLFWLVWTALGHAAASDGDASESLTGPPYEETDMNYRRWALPVLLGLALAVDAAARTLHERESRYHYIRVEQDGSIRSLVFRRQDTNFRESAMDMDDPMRLVLGYTKLMFAGFLFAPEPKDVLMVGLGAGVCPRVMRHSFPETHFDVIELDSEILAVAGEYFGFKEDPRLRVMVRDGRVGVKILGRRQRRYDVIMLDAFRAGYIPYHLTTKEFHEQCRALLKPGGVLVTNLWPSLMLYEYERRTMASVFAQQYAFTWGGNTIVVCLQAPSEVAGEELQRRAVALNRKRRIPFSLSEVATRLENRVSYAAEGQILTDDYAPANVLNSIPRE